MNKNEIVSLDIFDLNNLGYGVGKLTDGRVVFVPGAVSGDKVTAKLIKINAKYCVARLESIVEPSKNRPDEPFCSAPESCGGCVYRHVTYEHELELKRESVRAAFAKAGLKDTVIDPVRSAGVTKGYRNKAQYPVFNTKNGLSAGFYAAKTHRPVSGNDCALQPPVFAEIVEFICRYADKNGVAAYDELTGSGLLRHIYIRMAAGTGEIMVCPVLRHTSKVFDTRFAESLTERFPQVKSVMLNFNRKNTNVVTGEEYVCLGGRPYIEDTLLGLTFRVAPAAFWQVNHDGAELLYSIATERAGLSGGEALLDLYCGTGSIGLTMASRAKRLIGIEIVPDAVECAKLNAELNGIGNAEFYCGDASDTRGLIDSAERASGVKLEADVAVIDPPRKGTTPELIGYIAERGIERVVYVSCAADTLARDCAEFAKYGYFIDGSVTPVDMFPRTGHVECVCRLRKQTAI